MRGYNSASLLLLPCCWCDAELTGITEDTERLTPTPTATSISIQPPTLNHLHLPLLVGTELFPVAPDSTEGQWGGGRGRGPGQIL